MRPLVARASVLVLVLAVLPVTAQAQSSCRFAVSGTVMRLLGDCVTDASIEIPDGMTLDGDGHAIVAVDPRGSVFRGAVVVARGRWASVVNTTVSAMLLANACLEGEGRLRGIYFDGASGEIKANTIDGIHRVPSACEEGNGIEIRNRNLEAPATSVVIQGNGVDSYQKTGIVVHGNVTALVASNLVGSSVAQRLLAPNGIQVGPIAAAAVHRNDITGTFSGVAAAGSAILLMRSGKGTSVQANTISGDPDVGIHVFASGVTVADNVLQDVGPDGFYDVGIVNLGSDNVFINNTVVGFRTATYGVDDDTPASGRGQQIEE